MKIFIDTANLHDIEEVLKRGFVRGITTNPAIVANEPRGDFVGHMREIVSLIMRYQPGIPLSVEVFSQDPEEIIKQADNFQHDIGYENIVIKVQVGWNELAVIRELRTKSIAVNCTCCMDMNQAILAAAAGARYVSLFWNRIRDGGKELDNEGIKSLKGYKFDEDDFNPALVVERTRSMLKENYPGVEIIVGSIRSPIDVRDAGLAGAHIVTVPPKFFYDMVTHFKTDEAVQEFITKFKAWLI